MGPGTRERRRRGRESDRREGEVFAQNKGKGQSLSHCPENFSRFQKSESKSNTFWKQMFVFVKNILGCY